MSWNDVGTYSYGVVTKTPRNGGWIKNLSQQKAGNKLTAPDVLIDILHVNVLIFKAT